MLVYGCIRLGAPFLLTNTESKTTYAWLCQSRTEAGPDHLRVEHVEGPQDALEARKMRFTHRWD